MKKFILCNCAQFLMARHCFCLQNIKISLEYVDFSARSYFFLYPPFENSKIKVTIPEAIVEAEAKEEPPLEATSGTVPPPCPPPTPPVLTPLAVKSVPRSTEGVLRIPGRWCIKVGAEDIGGGTALMRDRETLCPLFF